MIQKIYDRKLRDYNILISGQSPYDIEIDGVSCFGGTPFFRCTCDLEMIKNETGKDFPNDVTLYLGFEFNNGEDIITIMIYRFPRERNITIQYNLDVEQLPLMNDSLKKRFRTFEDDSCLFLHTIKPEANLYDTVIEDIELLCHSTYDPVDKSLRSIPVCTNEERGIKKE